VSNDKPHETVAFRMRLHVGQADAYRQRHEAIWPELVALLRRAGVMDYRIFLDAETHHLFAVLTRRPDHTIADLPASDVMRRWWAMMGDIMATNADGSPEVVDLPSMFVLDMGTRQRPPANPA
jgi:L-rhamnose mutarotase